MTNRLTNVVVSETEVPGINTPQELERFRRKHELRLDWHEPDEKGIDAFVYGSHLDNAMGAGHIVGGKVEQSELNVVLTLHGKNIAVINLSTLLSWGSKFGAEFL